MCRCCHAAARGLGSDGLGHRGVPALTVDQAAVGAAVTGVTCMAVHLVSHVPRMSHPLRVLWQQAYTSRCPSSLVCLEHLVSLFRTTVNARVALSKFSVTPASQMSASHFFKKFQSTSASSFFQNFQSRPRPKCPRRSECAAARLWHAR